MRLSRNNIFEIHGMAFSGLNKFLRLDISHNLLTSAPSLFHLRSTLKSLDLSWNRIKSIGDSYFYLCIDIVQIYLDMNQITDFPNMQAISNIIAGISLQGNNISRGNSMYGIYVPRFDYLHLGYNQIENYCFPPWHFAPRLSQVYLQNNKISEMQFSHVTFHAQQTDICLVGNPWYCNNVLGWTELYRMLTQACTVWSVWLCENWSAQVLQNHKAGPRKKQVGYVVAYQPSNRLAMGLLPDTQNCGLRMRRECRERFPRHRRLEIPACITAHAWRTCRDACQDR